MLSSVQTDAHVNKHQTHLHINTKTKKKKKRKKGIKKKTLLTAGSVTGDNPEISMQSRL